MENLGEKKGGDSDTQHPPGAAASPVAVYQVGPIPAAARPSGSERRCGWAWPPPLASKPASRVSAWLLRITNLSGRFTPVHLNVRTGRLGAKQGRPVHFWGEDTPLGSKRQALPLRLLLRLQRLPRPLLREMDRAALRALALLLRRLVALHVLPEHRDRLRHRLA